MEDLVLIEKIESRIFHIRGNKVMLDRNLAALYQVEPHGQARGTGSIFGEHLAEAHPPASREAGLRRDTLSAFTHGQGRGTLRRRVETKQLTRQVRRNIKRFPDDFMFQLTRQEYQEFLRRQFGTLVEASIPNIFPMPLQSRELPCFPAC